jgi:DNA helicase-2/ATP-dependent DNA helicase PcrA
MQEERRLFYVGITRAMNQLYLIYTQHRSAYGYSEPCEPSQFLEDIPNGLVDAPQGRGGASARYETRYSRGGPRWSEPESNDRESPDPEPGPTKRPASSPATWQPANSPAGKRTGAAGATPKSIRFPPGTKVAHPVWGDGLVLNSKLQDDEEIVDIFFEAVGLKKVASSLARLTIKE